MAHGINTTVVEIDPAVYELALKHFHLPHNHTAVIEDAISYTERLAEDREGRRFDYIVHDVFTGGAEPIPLFTLEFLQSLNALLKPNGAIVIVSTPPSRRLRGPVLTRRQNFAGDFMLTPIKAVMHTIREVFPSCRIYREHMKDDLLVEKEGHDFVNVVVFCTKLSEPVTLRKPVYTDYLNSESRRQFLEPVFEVFESDFLSEDKVRPVRNNDTEQLAKYHDKSAMGHWEVMRRVMPASVWENW